MIYNLFQNNIQFEWNTKRLNKLVSLLGPRWFAGKKILEVGAGHGSTGKSLLWLGAHVVFTDARSVHVNHLKSCGLDAHIMDQDSEWTIQGPFDLIIHWGGVVPS
jgi:2-polyprenyl-3-methyl-5-hydroxy-6-metoxy-1,4-benzoquinol methylase